MTLLMLAGTLARADEEANAKLFEVHSRLAAKGSSEAQFKLGEMCEEGRGTPLDLEKAREWYELAAKQGHEVAKQRLATLGQRKPRDDEEKMAREAQLIKERTEEERRAALAQKREEEERRRAELEREARQKTEAERQRQMQAQKQAEEERARQAALARKKEEERTKAAAAAQPAAQTPPAIQSPKQQSPAAPAAGSEAHQESFETDPCKGAAARFMSTCR